MRSQFKLILNAMLWSITTTGHSQICLTSNYGAQIPATGVAACIQPGGVSGPTQPVIYITGLGNSCDYDAGTLQVSWSQPSVTGSAPHSTAGIFTTPQVQGGVIAYIDWTSNVYANPNDPENFEGGTAYLLNYKSGIVFRTTMLSIYGINPSTSLLTNAMQSFGNTPWYFGHTLTRESSNRQFLSNYTPVFGPPDGFGVSQIDASSASSPTAALAKLSDSAFWNWHWNLQEGVNLAASFQAPAYRYFQSQITLMLQSPVSPVYPPAQQWGSCQPMTWDGSGRNGLADAEWIEQYNTGGSAHYARWNGTTWIFNSTYPAATCQSQSATLPN